MRTLERDGTLGAYEIARFPRTGPAYVEVWSVTPGSRVVCVILCVTISSLQPTRSPRSCVSWPQVVNCSSGHRAANEGVRTYSTDVVHLLLTTNPGVHKI